MELEANPDVIASLAKHAPNAKVIGFAAEPSNDEDYAIGKISRKGLSGIVINDVSDNTIGFDSDANSLSLVFADKLAIKSGKKSKYQCAIWLMNELAAKLLT